jgi:hypothetical protein
MLYLPMWLDIIRDFVLFALGFIVASHWYKSQKEDDKY